MKRDVFGNKLPTISRDQVLPRFEAKLGEWVWHINNPRKSLWRDLRRTIGATVVAALITETISQ